MKFSSFGGLRLGSVCDGCPVCTRDSSIPEENNHGNDHEN